MLAVAFAERTLTGLVFSALVIGIATYFGEPFIFDPIVLIAIGAIAIFFRRNLDLFTICSAIVAERAFEELMWRFLENTIWFKIPTYFILVILAYMLSRGIFRMYLMSFFAIAISAEIYWFFINYKSPYILWPCFTIIEAVALARYFKMRAFWLIEMNPKLEVKPILLDTQLILTFYAFVIIYSLYTFEYYLRHLFGYSDLTSVYYAYPYLASGIAIYKLYLIVLNSVDHLRAIELDA